ncbi:MULTISPECIES: hypothetical protein [unclassified Micromonospora]|uniref:hypothetical protein n=1 Tax=unclassified Micromonospora TaxID=2617518 RepID=UPI0033F493EF
MSAIGSFLLNFLHDLNTLATIAGAAAGTFLTTTNATRLLRWYVERVENSPWVDRWRLHAVRTFFRLAVGVTCLVVFGPNAVALAADILHDLTTVI